MNLHEFQIEYSEGRYNIPIIKTEKFIPDKLIDFCHSLRSTQFSSGVHFFLDDFRFERVWRLPWRYIPHLRNFDVVLSPDFSLFDDNHIQLMSFPVPKYIGIGWLKAYYDITDKSTKEKLLKLLDAHRKSDE